MRDTITPLSITEQAMENLAPMTYRIDCLCGRYRLTGKPPPLRDTKNSEFGKNVMCGMTLVHN